MNNANILRVQTALKRRNELLTEYSKRYEEMLTRELLAIVRSGNASKYFDIGDEIVTTYTYEGTVYEFPWLMVDFKDVVKLVDNVETTVPAIILQAKYATIESIQFDHPEANNANTYIQQYGYNRYHDSAYRQWLNSSVDKGAWWTAQSETDEAPNELNTYKGFMAGFSDGFLSLIDPVQVKVATNTVTDGGVTDVMYDRFWLPSVEEMYGSPQASGIEGTYHPYWKQKTGFENPSNDRNAARVFAALNAKSSIYGSRLRSAGRGGPYTGWLTYTSGGLNGNHAASEPYRSIPDCAIT